MEARTNGNQIFIYSIALSLFFSSASADAEETLCTDYFADKNIAVKLLTKKDELGIQVRPVGYTKQFDSLVVLAENPCKLISQQELPNNRIRHVLSCRGKMFHIETNKGFKMTWQEVGTWGFLTKHYIVDKTGKRFAFADLGPKDLTGYLRCTKDDDGTYITHKTHSVYTHILGTGDPPIRIMISHRRSWKYKVLSPVF